MASFGASDVEALSSSTDLRRWISDIEARVGGGGSNSGAPTPRGQAAFAAAWADAGLGSGRGLGGPAWASAPIPTGGPSPSPRYGTHTPSYAARGADASFQIPTARDLLRQAGLMADEPAAPAPAAARNMPPLQAETFGWASTPVPRVAPSPARSMSQPQPSVPPELSTAWAAVEAEAAQIKAKARDQVKRQTEAQVANAVPASGAVFQAHLRASNTPMDVDMSRLPKEYDPRSKMAARHDAIAKKRQERLLRQAETPTTVVAPAAPRDRIVVTSSRPQTARTPGSVRSDSAASTPRPAVLPQPYEPPAFTQPVGSPSSARRYQAQSLDEPVVAAELEVDPMDARMAEIQRLRQEAQAHKQASKFLPRSDMFKLDVPPMPKPTPPAAAAAAAEQSPPPMPRAPPTPSEAPVASMPLDESSGALHEELSKLRSQVAVFRSQAAAAADQRRSKNELRTAFRGWRAVASLAKERRERAVVLSGALKWRLRLKRMVFVAWRSLTRVNTTAADTVAARHNWKLQQSVFLGWTRWVASVREQRATEVVVAQLKQERELTLKADSFRRAHLLSRAFLAWFAGARQARIEKQVQAEHLARKNAMEAVLDAARKRLQETELQKQQGGLTPAFAVSEMTHVQLPSGRQGFPSPPDSPVAAAPPIMAPSPAGSRISATSRPSSRSTPAGDPLAAMKQRDEERRLRRQALADKYAAQRKAKEDAEARAAAEATAAAAAARRAAKQQEAEKQRQLEEDQQVQRGLVAVAKRHDNLRLLKWYGLRPWIVMVQRRKARAVKAAQLCKQHLVGRIFRAWKAVYEVEAAQAKIEEARLEALAAEQYKKNMMKRVVKLLHDRQARADAIGEQLEARMRSKILTKYWNRKRFVFRRWKAGIVQQRLEAEADKRQAQLWNKVQQWMEPGL